MSSRLNQYIHFAPFDNVKSDVSNSESSYANTGRSLSLNVTPFLFNWFEPRGVTFKNKFQTVHVNRGAYVCVSKLMQDIQNAISKNNIKDELNIRMHVGTIIHVHKDNITTCDLLLFAFLFLMFFEVDPNPR